MADLEKDIAKLVSLAYPPVDTPTRQVLRINAVFRDTSRACLPDEAGCDQGKASTAHATDVDAVIEADDRKSSGRTGDVRVLGSGEDDLAEEVKKLQADLARTHKELKEAQRDVVRKKTWKWPLRDVTCYG